MKSRKTTIIGVLTIIGVVIEAAVSYLSGKPLNIVPILTQVAPGVGLILAGDHSTFANAITGMISQFSNTKEK